MLEWGRTLSKVEGVKWSKLSARRGKWAMRTQGEVMRDKLPTAALSVSFNR